MKRHTLFCVAAAFALVALEAAPARAGYHPASPDEGGLTAFELTLGIGVMGRNSTGPLLQDHGYAREPGPGADVAFRFLFGSNRYFRHGFTARGVFFAGRGFGRDGHAFRLGLADLTYTVRTLMPCISSRDGVRFYGSGSLGVTGGYADAGTGRGPMNDDIVARETAARELDHGLLGFVLGGTAEMHYGKLLVGISVDLRRLWGLDSPVRDSWVRSGTLRVGYRWDATDAPENPPEPSHGVVLL